MEILTLKTKTRKIAGKKVSVLRENGSIPGIVYGHGLKNKTIEVDYKAFKELFTRAGESTLIDLIVDEQKPIKVLIQSVQYHPLSDNIIHVDFHQVRTDEKITTEIELKFIGESKAVKEKGGILIKNLDKLKIECLPNDLIHEIEVDLSVLEDFDQSIRVSDLKISSAIKVLEEVGEMVVAVNAPRVEEVIEEKPEEKLLEEVKEPVEEEPKEK